PLSDSSRVSESRTPGSSSIRKTVPSSSISAPPSQVGLRSRPRHQADDETCAAEAAGLVPQVAPLMAQEGAAQGKAQSHTADFAGYERLEQPLRETRRDPGPGIIHANQHVRAAHFCRNLDAPRLGPPRRQRVESVE